VLSQITGNPAAGGPTHASTHDLHRGHERIGKQHGPGQGVTELCASLRVGSDSARIVVRCARDQARPENTQQSRFARFDDGTWTDVASLLDFEGHGWYPNYLAASITITEAAKLSVSI
jgi:hypothetical protein